MKYTLGIVCFFLITASLAVSDLYPFNDSTQAQHFNTLTTSLRCVVCQNQSLAESNAPLAKDLRDLIYKKIKEGESNEQIIQFLTNRYSHFILYKPPFNFSTIILWFLPLLIFIVGIFYLITHIRRFNR